jgi:ABC-type lipoprotein export system ATPase subunit
MTPQTQHNGDQEVVIAVMGATGSGKSTPFLQPNPQP